MYIDGNKKVGEAKVYRCPYCKDNEVVQSYKEQCEAMAEALEKVQVGPINLKSTNALTSNFLVFTRRDVQRHLAIIKQALQKYQEFKDKNG